MGFPAEIKMFSFNKVLRPALGPIQPYTRSECQAMRTVVPVRMPGYAHRGTGQNAKLCAPWYRSECQAMRTVVPVRMSGYAHCGTGQNANLCALWYRSECQAMRTVVPVRMPSYAHRGTGQNAKLTSHCHLRYNQLIQA
jgi:hypothetical protein